ncbi:non-canonical purine NTP pyrophosphatase [Patescibacteria group bacterium]|nr:non-canonical purine NTP pyrophosphatase [Patescibacteria group bacterium]
MQKLLIATKNPGKFREIGEGLDGLGFEFLFLGDMDVEDGDFVEDGKNFRENAFKKASYYGNKLGMMTFGEDSGIFVEALGDELGVQTRRWGAGEAVSDEEWLEYFLRRMEGEENRLARFVCAGCLFDGGVLGEFEGQTRGEISQEILAPILPGIPLSSCFIMDGADKVYAAMSAEEKNKGSHRGKVLAQVREHLGSKAYGQARSDI